MSSWPAIPTSELRATPFGSGIATRSSLSVNYRYSFNGKEKDNEAFEGCLAFEARIFDGRLGRFLSLDPRMAEYAWQTPYAYFKNCPVSVLDYLGLGAVQPVEEEQDKNLPPTNLSITSAAATNVASNYTWSDIDIQKLRDFSTSCTPCTNTTPGQRANWCCIDFFTKALSHLFGGTYRADGHMGDAVAKLVKNGKAKGPIKIKPTTTITKASPDGTSSSVEKEATVNKDVPLTTEEKANLNTNVTKKLESQLSTQSDGNYVYAVGPGQNIHCLLVVVNKSTVAGVPTYSYSSFDDHGERVYSSGAEFEMRLKEYTIFAASWYSEGSGAPANSIPGGIHLYTWTYQLRKPD